MTPPVQPPSTPLVLGSLVSDAISVAAEQDRYSFSLPAAALLAFDALTPNANIMWSLTGPTGTVVSNRSFTGSDAANGNPVLSLPTGNYVLTVAATGTNTGIYSFRLSDLATATVLTPGTPVTGSFDPANETDLFKFNAQGGDRFYFDSVARTNTGNSRWRLVDPFGNVLFASFFTGGDVDSMTLAKAGTYSLLLEGGIADAGVGTYTINVVPVPVSTTPLVLGDLVNGALAVPGEQDRYTFTLPTAAVLFFDSLSNNAQLSWSLTGPSGTIVSNRNVTGSDAVNGNPVLVLTAGDYALTLDGNAETTGAYVFRLSDNSSATPITPGTPFSGTLDPGNETDLYRFTATAGEKFYFDVLRAQRRLSRAVAVGRSLRQHRVHQWLRRHEYHRARRAHVGGRRLHVVARGPYCKYHERHVHRQCAAGHFQQSAADARLGRAIVARHRGRTGRLHVLWRDGTASLFDGLVSATNIMQVFSLPVPIRSSRRLPPATSGRSSSRRPGFIGSTWTATATWRAAMVSCCTTWPAPAIPRLMAT